MKTHPMWNPEDPAYADVGDVVGNAFAAGLRPDLLEALVRDTLRQHLDVLVPVLAQEITQRFAR